MTDREAGARAFAGSVVKNVRRAVAREAGACKTRGVQRTGLEAVGVQRAVFRTRLIGGLGVADLSAEQRRIRGLSRDILDASKLFGLLRSRIRALLAVCDAGVREQLFYAEAVLADETNAELNLAVSGPGTGNSAAGVGRVNINGVQSCVAGAGIGGVRCARVSGAGVCSVGVCRVGVGGSRVGGTPSVAAGAGVGAAGAACDLFAAAHQGGSRESK